VKRNWNKTNTNTLTLQPVNSIFPEQLLTIEIKAASKLSLDILPRQLSTIDNLVFRGVKRWSFFSSLEYGFHAVYDAPDNDWGPGIYYSWDINIAKEYAGSTGVILIIDFSGGGGNLQMKTFEGNDEWRTLVKQNVCKSTPLINSRVPAIDADFCIGPMSANHEKIISCAKPIPSQKKQLMAKTARAWEYMAKHLIGVIYLSE
jgi:hypothetical protein